MMKSSKDDILKTIGFDNHKNNRHFRAYSYSEVLQSMELYAVEKAQSIAKEVVEKIVRTRAMDDDNENDHGITYEYAINLIKAKFDLK